MVIKRDGRLVNFDEKRIITAVIKAFKAVEGKDYDKDYAQKKAENIAAYIKNVENEQDLSVEEIQDYVEKGLMSLKKKNIAVAYMEYRRQRTAERTKNSELRQRVKEKLLARNIQNQNANVDEASFGGRIGEAGDEQLRDIALNEMMSEKSRYNHINNIVYNHDLSHYPVGDHNCFHPDTSFITINGVKSFKDFKDGDIITVLTPNGCWNKATVQYHGKQKLNTYVLKKNRTEVSIRATKDHRWILQDGIIQEGLKEGDKLLDSPWYWEDFDFDELSLLGKEYWCYGFVLGDGTVETRYHKYDNSPYKTGRSRVKLCKDKSKYLTRFQAVGYGLNCKTYEPEIVGIRYNKTIPDFSKLPLECLIAFIHGFYDADGSHSLASNTGKPIYSIQNSNEKVCNFIEKYFPVAGLYINSIKDKTGQATNFATRGFTKSYQFFGQHSNKFNWYVKEIIQEDENLYDVWCLNVDDEHAFVLENGIPTGNCLTLPIDELLENGFKTRQTDIRPAGSLSTAFQLLAVTMQAQSLCQFG